MGLIKTAMMAGAGMYAVNKFAQASQNRRQSPQPQQQYIDQGASQQRYYDNGPNQGYQQQQQQQQQRSMPMEFTDRRGQQEQGGHPQYMLTNESSAPVPTYGYDAERGHYYEIDPRAASTRAPAMAYANGGSSPPPYRNSRQQPGFVEADEVSDSGFRDASGRSNNGGGSAAFLNTLMENAGDLKGGKGKDLMAKFMK
jgi:hypothetical protein